MEENMVNPKCRIFLWALGKDWVVGWETLYQRDKLWAQMAFWVIVSCQCCEEVMVILGLVPASRRASEAYPKV